MTPGESAGGLRKDRLQESAERVAERIAADLLEEDQRASVASFRISPYCGSAGRSRCRVAPKAPRMPDCSNIPAASAWSGP